MKRHSLLFIITTSLIFCLLCLESVEAQSRTVSNELAASIDSIFADKAHLTSPGASVIITKGGEAIYSQSYGAANIPFSLAFDQNTLFPLPNFTDQVVAFSILQLEKKGLIKLTDPINKYLPELGFEDPVLVDHLLNHSSGFPFLASLRLMAGWTFTDPFYENDFLGFTKQFSKDLNPDTKYQHSHTGIKVLQLLVAAVSGKGFSEYAYANIFKPLGMTSTVIKNEQFKENKHHSIGYNTTDAGFQRTYPTELALLCSMTYSTRHDFEKWMLNTQLRTFEGSIIQKMDGALSMKGISQKRSNGTYCLGQQQYRSLQGQHEFYIRDADEGHSWYWTRLEDLSIMVVSNLNSSTSSQVNSLISLFRPTTTTTTRQEAQDSPTYIISEKEMEACTGIYWNEQYLYTTEISIVDGALYHSDNDNGFNFPLLAITGTSFETPYGGVVEISDLGGNTKTLKNITSFGSVYASKQYDVEPLQSGDQATYVGHYSSAKLNIIYALVWEDQKLILKRSRKPDLALTPIGNQQFRTSEIDFRLIEFVEDENGAIQSLSISNTGVKHLEFMKLKP